MWLFKLSVETESLRLRASSLRWLVNRKRDAMRESVDLVEPVLEPEDVLTAELERWASLGTWRELTEVWTSMVDIFGVELFGRVLKRIEELEE